MSETKKDGGLPHSARFARKGKSVNASEPKPKLYDSPHVRTITHESDDLEISGRGKKANLIKANRLIAWALRLKGFDISSFGNEILQEMGLRRRSDKFLLVSTTIPMNVRQFLFGYEQAVFNEQKGGIHEIRTPSTCKFYYQGESISPAMTHLHRTYWLQGYDEGKKARCYRFN